MKKNVSLAIILFYTISSFAQINAMDEIYSDDIDSRPTVIEFLLEIIVKCVILYGIFYAIHDVYRSFKGK